MTTVDLIKWAGARPATYTSRPPAIRIAN